MDETDLVSQLCAVGISPRRGAALERFLDDKCPYGFSGAYLAKFMRRYARRVAFMAVRELDLKDSEKLQTVCSQLEMFTHTAYGFSTNRGPESRVDLE